MSWHLQASQYRWQSTDAGSLQFAVALSNLLAGVRDWQWSQTPGLAERPAPILSLFALRGRLDSGPLAMTSQDWVHHVRGHDLIAELPYSDQVPTGIECYWRPQTRDAGGLVIEWLVSANTRLLDEQIHWTVASEMEVEWLELGQTAADGRVLEWRPMPDGETEVGSTSSTWQEPLAGQLALLAKLPAGAGYVAMAAAVGDQRRIKVGLRRGENGTAHATLQHELQMGFLEKGVIRRARLWFMWMPGGESFRAEVQAQLQAFYLSPPPLTV